MEGAYQAQINVGQTYASRTHNGYIVQVTKATPRHIEGEVISNHEKGKRQYYRRSIFERSFDLIQDTKPVTPISPAPVPVLKELPHPDVSFVCSACNKPKPINDYRRLPVGRGVKGLGDKRVSICKACMSERISTGQRKHYQEVRTNKPQLEPKEQEQEPVKSLSGLSAHVLASELLELASRVDSLGTPPELTTLAYAVRDVLLEGTDAAGVFVVPKPVVDKLQTAFNSIKSSIKWEQDAKN